MSSNVSWPEAGAGLFLPAVWLGLALTLAVVSSGCGAPDLTFLDESLADASAGVAIPFGGQGGLYDASAGGRENLGGGRLDASADDDGWACNPGACGGASGGGSGGTGYPGGGSGMTDADITPVRDASLDHRGELAGAGGAGGGGSNTGGAGTGGSGTGGSGTGGSGTGGSGTGGSGTGGSGTGGSGTAGGDANVCPADTGCGDCAADVCTVPGCNGLADGGASDADADATSGVCTQDCPIGSACETDGTCASGHCNQGVCRNCPSGMIDVSQSTGGTYCIDAMEVSQSQYRQWLDSSPSTQGQSVDCKDNTFEPSQKGNCRSSAYTPDQTPKRPVVCVDWCDAVAYCAAMGKRLCGNLAGGPNAPDKLADPDQSQWYRACSLLGRRQYPYGDTYSPDACATAGYVIDVGTAPQCQSCAGLYDLSGNVAEWEDSCAASGKCQVRGGSFQDGKNGTTCDVAATAIRATANPTIGFRCCLD